MRIFTAAIVTIVLVSAMSGCGGGGGGSSPAGAQLATVQPDTTYTYDIAVSSGRGDSLAGQLILTISDSGTVLSKHGVVELNGEGRNFSSQIAAFFSQDSSGSLFYAGERNQRDGRNVLCESQALAVKSPLTPGETWSSTATLQGGGVEIRRSTVGAQQTISAAGRAFYAFPIETTRQNSLGSFTCITWYAPESPVPVKATGRMGSVEVNVTLANAGPQPDNGDEPDAPPPPPDIDGDTAGVGTDEDFDTPPPPPGEWEQQGCDIATVINQMLN